MLSHSGCDLVHTRGRENWRQLYRELGDGAATGMRSPRMQGTPPICLGLTVIRVNLMAGLRWDLRASPHLGTASSIASKGRLCSLLREVRPETRFPSEGGQGLLIMGPLPDRPVMAQVAPLRDTAGAAHPAFVLPHQAGPGVCRGEEFGKVRDLR